MRLLPSGREGSFVSLADWRPLRIVDEGSLLVKMRSIVATDLVLRLQAAGAVEQARRGCLQWLVL